MRGRRKVLSTIATVPTMHGEQDCVRISNKEYIGPVYSSTTFGLQTFYINPGSSLTFPWLSNLALNFQEYSFSGLTFYYKSLSANAVTTTALNTGSIVAMVDYNVTNANPANKGDMEMAMWSVSGKPQRDLIVPVETSKSLNVMKNLFIRCPATGVASNSDLHFYDVGKFCIAACDFQSGSNAIGELWVSYDIKLYKPTYLQAQGYYLPTAHWANNLASDISTGSAFGATSSTTLLDPLDPSAGYNPAFGRAAVYDNIGLYLSNRGITFPLGLTGCYKILLMWRCAGIPVARAGVNLTLGTCVGLTVKAYDAANTMSSTSSPGPTGTYASGSETCANLIFTSTISITDPTIQAVFNINSTGNVFPTGAGETFDCWVMQLSKSVE